MYTSARDARDTDWRQILALYDRLALLDPSPHVALNRTVALAEVDGARAGLASLHSLEDALGDDYAFHAVRADLLRRLGRSGPARDAYDSAIARVSNPAQAAFLAQRRDSLD